MWSMQMKRSRSCLCLPFSKCSEMQGGVVNARNNQAVKEINFSVLHPDIVFDHILPKLPVKSLLRFRCVCRSWLSFIDCAHFIKSHRLQPQRKFMHIAFSMRSSLAFRDTERSVIDDLDYSLFLPPFFTIVSSIDGLICLQKTKVSIHCFFRVFNPWTRKKIDLPTVDDALYLIPEFGFDPASSTYKLLVLYSDSSLRYMRCWMSKIISVGVDDSWRELGPCQELGMWRMPHYFQLAWIFNGAFHWIYETHPHGGPIVHSDHILAFDIGNEKFRTMAYPKIPKLTNFNYSRLFHMNVTVVGDTLYFVYLDTSSSTVDVWVLQDYWTQSWLKQYSFNCNFLDHHFKERSCQIMGCLDGDILSWEAYFTCNEGTVTLFTGTMGRCKIPGENTVTKMQWKPLFFKCEESLISYTERG